MARRSWLHRRRSRLLLASPQERSILDRFFSASRLRDQTALSNFATVVFEPLEQGIVTDFDVVRVVPGPRPRQDGRRSSAPVKRARRRVVRREDPDRHARAPRRPLDRHRVHAAGSITVRLTGEMLRQAVRRPSRTRQAPDARIWPAASSRRRPRSARRASCRRSSGSTLITLPTPNCG